MDHYCAGFPKLSEDTAAADILPTINNYILTRGLDVDFKNHSEETLFIQAAQCNKPEIMLFLIDQKRI